MKRYSASYVIKELQMKNNITMHLLEWPKSRTLTIYAGENVEQQEFLIHVLMWVQNDTATLEESLLVSHKTKHMLTIRSDIHTPWYHPNELKFYFYTKCAH